MNTHRIPLVAALLACPAIAIAADDADLCALRDEIAQMRASYEQRIDALERRLVASDSKTAIAETNATRPDTSASAQSSPLAGANAFNPNISLILSGLYSNLSRDPAGYRITGFKLPNGPQGDITPRRGFSLTEVTGNPKAFFPSRAR